MRLLVDTQILLWQFADDRRLSRRFRHVLFGEAAEVIFSDVSCWEVAIKHRSGKLPVTLRLFERECEQNRYQRLPIKIDHIRELDDLELKHGDPFDRLLIAQAIAENLPVLTADRMFSCYPIRLALE